MIFKLKAFSVDPKFIALLRETIVSWHPSADFCEFKRC